MVTTSFCMKPYLVAYMQSLYGNPVQLSEKHPVYHMIYQLTVQHPQRVSWHEKGNVTFVLPHPRHGKDPLKYNFIGAESAAEIEKTIEGFMCAEMHVYLIYNKHKNKVMYTKSMHKFVTMYHMEELVQEETLMREFQRWRKEEWGGRI